MNLKELEHLIMNQESDILEFKKSTAQLKNLCYTLCGFLNHKGGIVLVGVSDTGKIIGQDVTDHTRQEIANELQKFEPLARIQIEYVNVDDTNKKVIVLTAPSESHSAPYTFDGRAYQRCDAITVRMSQQEYQRRVIERMEANISWETMVALDYNINMLDHEEIKRTVDQGIKANRMPVEAASDTIAGMLKRFHLMKGEGILNAAVVLFAKEITPNYMHCLLKMARFAGINKSANFIDNKQIEANAFQLLEHAESFIKEHLRISSVYQANSFQRVDEPTVPVLAVREALINAIIHRLYSGGVGSISLAIFDDRLTISNYGSLPSVLSIESLKRNDESVPRNKLIARIFYLRKFVERWGTGIKKMMDSCIAAGLPEPDFENESGSFSITFKFREALFERTEDVSQETQQDTLVRITDRQQVIMDILLKNKPLSLNEISSLMLVETHSRLIRNDLYALKKLGKIDTLGVGRGAVWFVKK